MMQKSSPAQNLNAHWGRRRTLVQIFNAPADLHTEMLGAFLSNFGEVEKIDPARSKNSAHLGSYTVVMWVKREGFLGIPSTISFKEANIKVVVEGHMVKNCPQKAVPDQPAPQVNTAPAAGVELATEAKKSPTPALESTRSKETKNHWSTVAGHKQKNTSMFISTSPLTQQKQRQQQSQPQ